MFSPTTMSYSPSPIIIETKTSINLTGNWKANATDLFGVLATITMDSDQSSTQIMFYCRDEATSTC